jgi:hypothetical protein
MVRSNGSKLIGELWRDRRKKDDYKMGELDTFRRHKRSVTIRVPLAKMKTPSDRQFYRWIAKTLMIGENCRAVCIDRIPDQGTERQNLPGVVPTPTPTETPTVEPTPTPSP